MNQRTRADTATAQAVDGDRTGQEAVPPQKCDSRARLWPAQRVARRQALPAQGSQPRSVRMAPAGHRVQSQEPPRGVEVWGHPSVALWGRSAAPTGALPDRRTPPPPAPSPSLSPFCSYHLPSDCVPHPTHHAPYRKRTQPPRERGLCRGLSRIWEGRLFAGITRVLRRPRKGMKMGWCRERATTRIAPTTGWPGSVFIVKTGLAFGMMIAISKGCLSIWEIQRLSEKANGA